MIFARRKKPDWREKLRVAAWPRRSWPRAFRYVGKRTWRIAGSPHSIALGFAFGAFMSFTPLMGLHILIAAGLAWACNSSMIASALGTAVGNPLTFPFIWASSLGLGNWMLGRTNVPVNEKTPVREAFKAFDETENVSAAWGIVKNIWEPLLKPMFVGGTPIGLLCAAICYILVRKAVAVFQARRREAISRRLNKAAVAAE